MKVPVVVAMVFALLVGVWSMFTIWSGFSLVSEGRATAADLWPMAVALAVLAADAVVVARLVDRVGRTGGA